LTMTTSLRLAITVRNNAAATAFDDGRIPCALITGRLCPFSSSARDVLRIRAPRYRRAELAW
jgi:hypothetical protein